MKSRGGVTFSGGWWVWRVGFEKKEVRGKGPKSGTSTGSEGRGMEMSRTREGGYLR